MPALYDPTKSFSRATLEAEISVHIYIPDTSKESKLR